jgi:hypothetical protein
MATYQKNPFSGEEKANEKKKENWLEKLATYEGKHRSQLVIERPTLTHGKRVHLQEAQNSAKVSK